jgi:hypothetical protein
MLHRTDALFRTLLFVSALNVANQILKGRTSHIYVVPKLIRSVPPNITLSFDCSLCLPASGEFHAGVAIPHLWALVAFTARARSRFLRCRSCLYERREERVIVLRILHGAQRWPS